MTKNDYTVVEFYAGAARLAKLATALGESCAAMDILYDLEGLNKRKHNAMDMNTNAGFVSLAFDLCFSLPAVRGGPLFGKTSDIQVIHCNDSSSSMGRVFGTLWNHVLYLCFNLQGVHKAQQILTNRMPYFPGCLQIEQRNREVRGCQSRVVCLESRPLNKYSLAGPCFSCSSRLRREEFRFWRIPTQP